MARHNFIYDFLNVISKAHDIKNDEERRVKSVRFGITSIVFSVFAFAFAVCGAFLLSLLSGGNAEAILLFIFTIAGIAAAFGSAVMLFIGALLRVIAQLTINRKPIGWIALALFVVCLVAAVVVIAIIA